MGRSNDFLYKIAPDCYLDEASSELILAGVHFRLRLKPAVSKCLEYLLANVNRKLSYDQIIDGSGAWEYGSYKSVQDAISMLNSCVRSAVKEAAGKGLDVPEKVSFVQNISGYGYKCVAERVPKYAAVGVLTQEQVQKVYDAFRAASEKKLISARATNGFFAKAGGEQGNFSESILPTAPKKSATVQADEQALKRVFDYDTGVGRLGQHAAPEGSMGQPAGKDNVTSLIEAIETLQTDTSVVSHCFLTGEGGIGKTYSMFYLWREFLQKENVSAPVFLPLNVIKSTSVDPEENCTAYIRESLLAFCTGEDVTREDAVAFLTKTPGAGECPGVMLLLDGLNEVEPKVAEALINEIRKCADDYRNVHIILTSRRELRVGLAPLSDFRHIALQPLSLETVADYLQTRQISVDGLLPNGDDVLAWDADHPKKRLWELLRNPLMLTIYCALRQASGKEGEYLQITTAGELLEQYFRWLVAVTARNRSRISGGERKIRFCAECLLPTLAYQMQSQQRTFWLSYSAFNDMLTHYLKGTAKYPYCSIAMENVKGNDGWAVPDSPDMAGQLIWDLSVMDVVEQNGVRSCQFKHQHLRDWLSAKKLSNMLHDITDTSFDRGDKRQWLCEIFAQPIEPAVAQFLGELCGEHRDQPEWTGEAWCSSGDRHYPLTDALTLLRGSFGYEYAVAVSHILQVIVQVRGELSGLSLIGLDLSQSRLNGVICSRCALPELAEPEYLPARFDHSLLQDGTLMPTGHASGITTLCVYQEHFVLSVSAGQIWCHDIRKGTVGKVFPIVPPPEMPQYGRCVSACLLDSTADRTVLAVGTTHGAMFFWRVEHETQPTHTGFEVTLKPAGMLRVGEDILWKILADGRRFFCSDGAGRVTRVSVAVLPEKPDGVDMRWDALIEPADMPLQIERSCRRCVIAFAGDDKTKLYYSKGMALFFVDADGPANSTPTPIPIPWPEGCLLPGYAADPQSQISCMAFEPASRSKTVRRPAQSRLVLGVNARRSGLFYTTISDGNRAIDCRLLAVSPCTSEKPDDNYYLGIYNSITFSPWESGRFLTTSNYYVDENIQTSAPVSPEVGFNRTDHEKGVNLYEFSWEKSKNTYEQKNSYPGHRMEVKAADYVCRQPGVFDAVSCSIDRSLILWDRNQCKPRIEYPGYYNGVRSVVPTTDPHGNEVLFVGTYDGCVSTWFCTNLWNGEASQNLCVATMGAHEDWLWRMDYIRRHGGLGCPETGKTHHYIVSAGYDHTVRFWNVETGIEETLCKAHSGKIYDVRYIPEKDCVLTASADRRVLRIDLKTLRSTELLSRQPVRSDEVESICSHYRAARSVAYHAHGDTVLSGGIEGVNNMEYGTLMLEHDFEDGRFLRRYAAKGGQIRSIDVSRDGKYILTAGTLIDREKCALLWPHYEDPQVQTVWDRDAILLEGGTAAVGVIEYAVFSPEGRFAVTTSKDGRIRFYDLAQITPETRRLSPCCILEQDDQVYTVAFSADGKTLYSASLTGTLYFWNYGRLAADPDAFAKDLAQAQREGANLGAFYTTSQTISSFRFNGCSFTKLHPDSLLSDRCRRQLQTVCGSVD